MTVLGIIIAIVWTILVASVSFVLGIAWHVLASDEKSQAFVAEVDADAAKAKEEALPVLSHIEELEERARQIEQKAAIKL